MYNAKSNGRPQDADGADTRINERVWDAGGSALCSDTV